MSHYPKLTGVLKTTERLTASISTSPSKISAQQAHLAKPIIDGIYRGGILRGDANGWYDNNDPGQVPDGTWYNGSQVFLRYHLIELLNPSTFIQFKFPIFNETQVLWQDAEGTIPVRMPGDNIGRAVCVVSGKAMVQVNPAWKPVWDGEKAAFSGSQYLIAEDHDMGGFLHWHLPCQWILKASAARAPATQYFLTTQTYGSPRAGMNSRFVNDGLLIYNRSVDATPNIGVYQYNNGAMDSELHPVGYQIRSDRAWQITKDGCRVGGVQSYETSDLGDPLYPLTIGTQLPSTYPSATNPANNNSLVGDVEYLAIYKRELTQAEQREHL